MKGLKFEKGTYGKCGMLRIPNAMFSIFLAYLPKVDLCDLLPVCVSSLSLLGNGVSYATRRR
jgi:hypothetical protein